ncbi:hypothetical protein M422DRAFT_242502 [Sphaerobolus stellatus SS14]|nr:hypothetical protein M422DRAFT_242502 [Sphaerobolus stellatus SS14]
MISNDSDKFGSGDRAVLDVLFEHMSSLYNEDTNVFASTINNSPPISLGTFEQGISSVGTINPGLLIDDLVGLSASTENFSTVPNVGAVQDVINELNVGDTTNRVRLPLSIVDEAPTTNVAAAPTADTVFPNNSDDYIDHVEKKDKTLTLLKTYIKHRTRLNPPSKPYHCAYMKTYKSSCGKSFETMDEALMHVESHLKNVTKICRLCGQCFTKARDAKKHTVLGRCRPKRG